LEVEAEDGPYLTDFQLEQLVQIMNEQNEALMENYRQIAQKEKEMVPAGISDQW
jgi:hypothetical protein